MDLTNNDVFFLKLDKMLIISDSKGNIINDLSIDFKIELDNNIFDLFEILICIQKKKSSENVI